MTWTVLFHDQRLGASDGPGGPPAAHPPADTRVVAFRRPPDGRPQDFRSGVNATTRFTDLGAEHLTFLGLETDSALAPLILWDAAHALPVGGTITLTGDAGLAPYLGRSYFRDGLTLAKKDAAGSTFSKTHELPAERDRGMDRWTFGIPTGPGDATGLNAVVKRILELGVPEFEIILCGRPGANFRYLDRVTVVGEDLNRLPVPIAAKKNRLAESARFENLCLIHDRVFLPRDFYEVVKRFGDLYPVVGLQSLWFDDPFNLVGKRYSDYCRQLNPGALSALSADPQAAAVYRPGLFAEVERGGFVSANPLRYNAGNYCTGSLYIAKRSVWKACPQDPALNWQELEDVEYGHRCERAGVPHRINPWAFTQSLFTRPQLLCRGLLYETASGRLTQSVHPLEEVWFRRKPLARVQVDEAHRRLLQFARKWVPRQAHDVHQADLRRRPTDAHTWAKQVGIVVYAAAMGYGAARVREFIGDYEKLLAYDAYGELLKRHLVEHFAVHGGFAKDTLVEHGSILTNMLLYRRRGHLFFESQAEYFPERGRWLGLGTLLSARRFAKHDGQTSHHPGGVEGYRLGIRNSTPYREYYEE